MTCAELNAKMVEEINAYNEALKVKDLDKMLEAETNIKDFEGKYAKQAQLDLFSSHRADADPVREVLKEGFYGTKRHKVNRIEGVVTGWELDNAEKQVDLKELFKYLQKDPTLALLRIERLTQTLVKWADKDIEGNKSKVIDNSFKMSKKAKEISVGSNPTSNTSLLKLVQSIIDLIVVPGEDGSNAIRANNRDLKFLQHCFTGEGRGHTGLKTMKASGVVRIICKIIYRILNNYAYEVEFKTIVESNSTLEAQRAANRKAKAEKAKAEAEKAQAEQADPNPIVVDADEEAAD